MNKIWYIVITLLTTVVLVAISIVLVNQSRGKVSDQMLTVTNSLDSVEFSKSQEYFHKKFTTTEIQEYVNSNPDKLVMISTEFTGAYTGVLLTYLNRVPSTKASSNSTTYSATSTPSTVYCNLYSPSVCTKSDYYMYFDVSSKYEVSPTLFYYTTNGTTYNTKPVNGSYGYHSLSPADKTTYISVPIISNENTYIGVTFLAQSIYEECISKGWLKKP